MKYLKDKYIWLKTETDSFKCSVVDVDTTGILVNCDKDYTHGEFKMQSDGSYDYKYHNKGLATERYYPFTAIKEIVVIDTKKMMLASN